MKSTLRELIAEFHEGTLPALFKRQVPSLSLPKSLRKAIVYIGMRRAGKTYKLYEHMQEALDAGLPKTKLLYLNFEDDRLQQFTSQDFQLLLEAYFELYPEYLEAEDLIFYFDEIQNIPHWEQFIRRLLDKEKMQIFITGSSATLLSKEIASSLRGRCLSAEIFPLNFSEYLHYKGITHTKTLSPKIQLILKHEAMHYLRAGGFPETLELPPNLHQRMIQSYVNATVFRDVIERYQLNNPHIIKLFLIHCLQNIAAPLSITKVFNTLKSRGETLARARLYEYLTCFEDAYLLHTVPIYDLSTRKRQVNPSKIYCSDNGILMAYTIKPHMEQAACLENAVFLSLRQRDYDSIFYYKTQTGKEIDFITQTHQGEHALFQVCVALDNESTRKREIQAILEAANELKLNKAMIITMDTEEKLSENNIDIQLIPFWRFASSAYIPSN